MEEKEPTGTENNSGVSNEENAPPAIPQAPADDHNPIRLSSLKPNDELIKKRGFLLTLDRSATSQDLLDTELTNIRERYAALLRNYEMLQAHRLAAMQEQAVHRREEGTFLIDKQQAYQTYLSTLKDERVELDAHLADLYTQLRQILAGLGAAKEGIVTSALKQLEGEVLQLMKLSQSLQDDQNKALEERFVKEQDAFRAKADFWRRLLDEHRGRYEQVTKRLKVLAGDGVDPQTAKLLLYLGGVGALVSGWWFAIWSGPLPLQDERNNIAGNSNLRFFFLDHIGKYLGQFSPPVMVLIILAYLVLTGLLSWGCHHLLIRYGLIADRRKLRKHPRRDPKENDNFNFDVEEMEKLLETRIRSTAWWGFWLKLMPVILALLPLLGVIAHQLTVDAAAIEKTNKGLVAQGRTPLDAPTFQSLFDSMVNEFIGTSIAIMFSVFMILYLSRVSENRYHRQEESARGSRSWFLYVGFVAFGLMIMAMILYHYNLPPFDELRRVAIFGFVVSCLATASSLSYGYIFNGLRYNADVLLYAIEGMNNVVQYYSRPIRVNYTSYQQIRDRIGLLQQKMFDLIEGRAILASAIASGKAVSHSEVKPFLVMSHTTEDEQPAAQPEKSRKEKRQLRERVSETAKQAYRSVVSVFHKPQPLRSDHTSEEFLDELKVSSADLRYFPETATALKELHQRIREFCDRKTTITQEEHNYWHNQGTWHSITDQIRNNRADVLRLERQIEAIHEQGMTESENLKRLQLREETMLKEGYYTGIWFRDTDPAQQLTIN